MKSSQWVAASALCVAASSGLFGCVTSDEDPATNGTGGAGGGAAGSAQSGNAGSGGSSSGSGGSSMTGQGGATGPDTSAAVACPSPTLALMTDFSPPAATGADAGADAGAGAGTPPVSVSWGDYTTQFSGSTYQYPNGTQMYALPADFSGGSWHVTGTVGNYSGLGVAFGPNGCSKVDASAYSGIAFDISGSIGAATSAVQFTVGTAGNDIGYAWLNANTQPATPVAPNFGRCTPAATQYDGTCSSPSLTVPVGATVSNVQVQWAQLIGGQPNATVNPAEITFMSWVLPAPMGAGTPGVTTYDIDITIDNLRFIE